MASPTLYTVNKISLMDIVKEDYFMILENPDGCHYNVSQQDNMLFRQIRLITKNEDKYNPYVLFVDCKGQKNKVSELSEIILNGFYFNGKKFVVSERSASMSRNSILSFVDQSISEKLNERITMGINFEKTVLSKYVAYRGLMFSSCFCLDGWFPKVIVVDDYETVIPNQHIKFLKDEVVDFVDKNGVERTWKQKAITEGVRDLPLNAFDGCGLHHPLLTKEVKARIGMRGDPTSILWRFPYSKGVTHQFDYTNFLAERGVETIKDIWGVEHSVYEPMMIITKSMYKGFGYFKNTGTVEDWNRYWINFHKYNHCFGVAKWNFSFDEEPAFTGANYQILQDLDLHFDDFMELANASMDYIERVIAGDPAHTYHFLGLMADKHDGLNNYMRAVLKDPEMMKETGVRKYITGLLRKKMDDMKAGKIYLDATFKFVAPDLIALAEHIGGLPVTGVLESDEFWTQSKYKKYKGEYLIERNPHIAHSEHVILKQREDELITKWVSHLQNVCMINSKSATNTRLNGCDFDGDLVLVVDNPTMMSGVHRGIPFVVDIEDKVTALAEPYTQDGILKLILRNFNSLIGEASNAATTFHSIEAKTPEQAKRYQDYIDTLSVVTGKSIDFAKTGVMFNIPRHIAKYAKPLPYFMKYRSEYYKGLKKFRNNNSNMNMMCRAIERWERVVLHEKMPKDERYHTERNMSFVGRSKKFNYEIMQNKNIAYEVDEYSKIEKVFLDFCENVKELSQEQYRIRHFSEYKTWVEDNFPTMTKEDSVWYTVDWQYYYNSYRLACREIVHDQAKLANIVVDLLYRKYKSKNRNFLWVVASEGVLQNLQQIEVRLPVHDDNGDILILGKHYSMEEIYD